MKFAGIFISLSTIVALLYFFGVLFFLSDHEPHDNCQMTYMFEYPQYIRISQSIDRKYPNYGLFVYGEGRTTAKARNMDFNGIPILFVPGNSGSYQQVRSLASVALRKALNSRTNYHFDYFTVNFNSEYSAVYGPLLNCQLEYVNHSIYRVLELYGKNANGAKQVILIGHSIGGVIAEKVLSLLPIGSNVVPMVITLAAPFQRPLIIFDKYLEDFYWMYQNSHDNTNIFSIAGGFSDFLIPSYLTELNDNHSIHLVTTNIPRSWIEAGHVQIVWCKQTVLALNRALFDIVDFKTKKIISNKTSIENIFKHHLISNSGTKVHLRSELTKQTNLESNGEWIENLNKQFSVQWKKGVRQPHWHMIGLTSQPNYEMLTVLAVNMETQNWIYACNAAYTKGASRVCLNGLHLSHFSEIIPSAKYKRRLITLNMHKLRKSNFELTHVVFAAMPTSEPLSFHVDNYGSFERKCIVSLPLLPFKKHIIVLETPPRAVIYNIHLTNLKNMLQSYQIFVEPNNCSTVEHHATIILIVPWSNQNVHQHFMKKVNNPFHLRLQGVKPKNSQPAHLKLILEPTCTYKISAKVHVIGMFGQMARLYSPLLLSNIAIVVLLGFQELLLQISSCKKGTIFFPPLIGSVKHGSIILLSMAINKLLSFPFVLSYVPVPDTLLFPNGGDDLTDFLLMPILMYMVSSIIVAILVSGYYLSLFALESTIHKLVTRVFARTVTFTIKFSDYLVKFLQRVPFVVIGFLIFLCMSTCGGLGLCVGMVFYFLKLTEMSQDYVEDVIWIVVKRIVKRCKYALSHKENNALSKSKNEQTQNNGKHFLMESKNSVADSKKGETEGRNNLNNQNMNKDVTNEQSYSPIFFHTALFFIWALVTILNIPSVLTWAHNFMYSKILIPDVSFLPGLVLSICALPLWHLELPRTNSELHF
ncbi:GPI inositol-deacylase isoform X2 [Cylas formicarius]|uniref:GPI inositol-deacylase isoform X2 n=1 Tax=Cylas formicarius TaxID=197179 RepID=UPI0029587FEC|nr:GPI inositol-deacylase isoform X2 [Cylas formicarius]